MDPLDDDFLEVVSAVSGESLRQWVMAGSILSLDGGCGARPWGEWITSWHDGVLAVHGIKPATIDCKIPRLAPKRASLTTKSAPGAIRFGRRKWIRTVSGVLGDAFDAEFVAARDARSLEATDLLVVPQDEVVHEGWRRPIDGTLSPPGEDPTATPIAANAPPRLPSLTSGHEHARGVGIAA